jgi:hypothetical protein
MRKLISEGDRLASVLMASIKEHYGPRSEKVAEFGAQTPATPTPGTPVAGPGGATTPTGSSQP